MKLLSRHLTRIAPTSSNGWTNSTYKVMMRTRNHVTAFIKSFYKRTDMFMLELTPDFIKEFAAYLTTERELKNATIWLNCMWLKGVVMCVHHNGLIPRNPFAQFHISPNVKEREYLTEDKIKTIITHKFENPTLTLVRDLFIFACFTALSFVDMKELPTDEIVEVNGEKWIIGKRHRNDVPFQVKLLDIPLPTIDRYRNRSDNNEAKTFQCRLSVKVWGTVQKVPLKFTSHLWKHM